MEYRVELDVFNGPLDLLLYLIKRDELDIYDIPLARITDSYMASVNMLKGLTTAGKIYGRPEEAYLLAAVVYFVICFGLSYIVKKLQNKIAIIR